MYKFGLIGYPLGHSLSAVIHKAGFKSIGVQADYEILETPPEDLVTRIKFLKRENYTGFNVTIPLKLPVALFVDEVDRRAHPGGGVVRLVVGVAAGDVLLLEPAVHRLLLMVGLDRLMAGDRLLGVAV